MVSESSQPSAPHVRTAPLQSSSDIQTSSFKNYVARRRRWLTAIALVLIACIVVGIIFTAHTHYHSFGGEGFLKSRGFAGANPDLPRLFLSLRKIEVPEKSVSWDPRTGRSPKNVPFYTCGDQQQSCEAYGQPTVCCPVLMVCYPTLFTLSNIYCCNSTTSTSDCYPSIDQPPKCLSSTVECSANLGGGCCPMSTQCSPNGCIQAPDIQRSTSAASQSSADAAIFPNQKMSSTSKTDPYAYQTSVFGGKSGDFVSTTTFTDSVTVIQSPTVTVAKEGEVAQKGTGVKKSVCWKLCLPYTVVWGLVTIAAIMGML